MLGNRDARELIERNQTRAERVLAVHAVYKFGPFLLDPGRHILERRGQEVPLKPKSFEVLCHLVAHFDRTVSRSELLEQIWSGVYVTDNALSRCIADLRKSLGDNSESPIYIRTIPRIGYRFVGQVEVLSRDVQAAGRSVRPVVVVAALVTLLVVAAVLVWKIPGERQRIEEPPVAKSRKLPMDFPGNASAAAWGPDGTRFVFVGRPMDDAAPAALYRGSLESAVVERLAQTEGASRPSWSSSGNGILFQKRDGVWLLSADNARLLLPGAANARWSGDGNVIVFERDFEIWVTDPHAGTQRAVVGPRPADLLLFGRTPALSHDGSEIVYIEPLTQDRYELRVQGLDGSNVRTLALLPPGSVNPVWSPDDAEIFFEMPDGTHRDLFRIPVDGGQARSVLSGAGGNSDLTFAGPRFLYTHTIDQSELVLLDPSSDSERVVWRSLLGIGGPEFAPGGQRLAVFTVDDRIDPFNLSLVELGGRDTVQRATEIGPGLMPQWSVDGDIVYYYQTRPASAFARLDLVEGSAGAIVADWEWDTQNGAQVDPTNRQIIYSALDRGVPVATVLRQLDTGSETPFHTALKWPRWSAAGDRILGTQFAPGESEQNGRILACRVQNPRCRVLAEGRVARWSADESRVYFTRLNSDRWQLWSIGLDPADEPQLVHGDLGLYEYNDFFDVGPNDLIAWVRQRAHSRLWMSQLR